MLRRRSHRGGSFILDHLASQRPLGAAAPRSDFVVASRDGITGSRVHGAAVDAIQLHEAGQLQDELDRLVRTHGIFAEAAGMVTDLAIMAVHLGSPAALRTFIGQARERNRANGCSNTGPSIACFVDFSTPDACSPKRPAPGTPVAQPDVPAGDGPPHQTPPGNGMTPQDPTRPEPRPRVPPPPLPPPKQGGATPGPALPSGRPRTDDPDIGVRPKAQDGGTQDGQQIGPPLPPGMEVGPAGGLQSIHGDPVYSEAHGKGDPEKVKKFKRLACHPNIQTSLRAVYLALNALGDKWAVARAAALVVWAWLWICDLTDAQLSTQTGGADLSRPQDYLWNRLDVMCANFTQLRDLLDKEKSEPGAAERVTAWLDEEATMQARRDAENGSDERQDGVLVAGKTAAGALRRAQLRAALDSTKSLALLLEPAIRESGICSGNPGSHNLKY